MAKKEDKDAKEGAKSGMGKWILIWVLSSLLLVGGTVSTLYFAGFIGKPAAKADAAAGKADPPKDKVAAKKPKKGPQIYLPLDPAFVVNFPAKYDVRFLQVAVQVSAYDQEVIDQVKQNAPAIRDALVMLFSSQNPKQLNTREGKEALRKQALAAIRKVMTEQTGKPGVNNIYFTSFVMQ